MADLLASHPRWPEEEKNVTYVMNTYQRPECWTLYFDGAAVGLRGGAGASGGTGVVLMDPDGQLHLHAYSLNYFCTNNTAEYDALILGLELAAQMDIRRLLVKGDSLLIIQQVLGKFDVKEQQLVVCKAKS